MKAAFYEGHESIAINECVRVAPGPDEVQIQIPQVTGHESSGTIVAVLRLQREIDIRIEQA